MSDDKTLFLEIADGSEKAFETIFHRYTPKLRPFVTGIVKVSAVADEIVQEVFLKLWLNKENLVHVQEPASWLYRLASNAAINQLRRQAVEYRHLKQAMESAGQDADDLLQQLSARELQQLIHEAVSQLPPKRREIYLLSREKGLSHKEIAEQLQISLSTVKNQMVSALRNIQDHIDKTRGIHIPLILLTFQINLVTA